MSNQQANDLAFQEGLDLVEISSQAKPPVCAIMDFGKWKFDEKKKEKEQKQKTIQSKEVRLRPVSSDHDIAHKVQQVRTFLSEKRTVVINMRFKNRELAHKENGKRIIEEVVEMLKDVGVPLQMPRFEGSTLSVRFAPK